MSGAAPLAPVTEDAAGVPGELYQLELYVAGTTANSARALVNVRLLCDSHLAGRYALEVIDISRHPARAVREQITAAPTLIKKQPLPLRRFIGDMSQTEQLLRGLALPAGDGRP